MNDTWQSNGGDDRGAVKWRMRPSPPTRRRILGAALATAGLAATASTGRALASGLVPTPRQGRGPFYPLEKPLDRDNDLTRVEGQGARAEGRVLHLLGQVLDSKGRKIEGARVEIWQADSFGRYNHPGDRQDAPRDPGFQGFGEDLTDAAGAYRFRTIEPAAYAVSANWMRPPHIHFAVTAPGYRSLVTQMYFAGNPLNEKDGLLGGISDNTGRARLIAALQPPPPELDPASAVAQFDIVLNAG